MMTLLSPVIKFAVGFLRVHFCGLCDIKFEGLIEVKGLATSRKDHDRSSPLSLGLESALSLNWIGFCGAGKIEILRSESASMSH